VPAPSDDEVADALGLIRDTVWWLLVRRAWNLGTTR